MRSRWLRFQEKVARSGPLVVLGLLMAGSLYQALCHTEAFADDAAITFSYSRQLASTGEFIHTASSERVEGFSNPTWTVLCTLPFLLHMDPFIFARTIGVICLLVTLLLVFKTSQRLLSSSSARFSAPLFVGMAPCVCFWTMAGLENPLFTLLIATLIWQVVREELDGAKDWSGLIVVGLALSRPEGVIYALPVVIYKGLTLFRRPREERRPALRRHLTNLIWLVVPLAGFIVWRRLYFGQWLPNTYFAKLVSPHLLPADPTYDSRALRYVEGFFDIYRLWPLVFAAPLAIAVRKRWAEALLLLSIVGTHLAFVFIVDGDWMGDFRFFSLAMPAYALLLGMVIQGCADLISRLPERWWPSASVVIGRVIAGALFLSFLFGSLLPTLSEYERAGWVSMSLVRQQGIGLESIARRTGMLRASVALPDVGGSAMDTNLRIYDTVGLVDPVIARSKARPDLIRQYFFEDARPDFYQAHSHWRRYFNIPLHDEFHRDYVTLPEPLAKRLVLLGKNSMRREHLTATLAEAEHRAAIDVGGGLIVRGYDSPILVEKQLVVRCYVQHQGKTPQHGDLLVLSLRSKSTVEETAATVDLSALPSGLFQSDELLRLRLKAPSGPVDAIAFRGSLEQETMTWLPVKTVSIGQHSGADLEHFVMYPRTHFACAPLPPTKRGEEPPLFARGRLQIFDGCQPVHRSDEVEQLVSQLWRRAHNALDAGLPRAAIVLLNRAELLAPESRRIRRSQRRAALATFRRARDAERQGELEKAYRLAVDALRAEPLLVQARALTLALPDRGFQVFPDTRERAEISRDRLKKAAPTRVAIREMLVATLAADRPYDGARVLDEVGLELVDDDELRVLTAETFLALGLCERTLEVVGPTRGGESCHLRRLRSQAGRLCGQKTADAPRCGELPLLSAQRPIFEFEGWDTELDGWDVDGQLQPLTGSPEFYISGYSGLNLVRTDVALNGTFRATSPEFTIDQEALSVQVGGGSLDDGVVVALIVDGLALRRGAGERDHHLRRLTWDVSELMGRNAAIRIVDQGQGEWGFILVDHIRFHPRHELDPDVAPL